MDFSLDDEQGMVVQMVRRFVERDVRAWAADADREGAPPRRLDEVARGLGFFDDALADGPYSHTTRALRGIELGRGCAAIAALLECNVEPALAVQRWGSEDARAAVRASLSQGGLATTARDSQGRLELHDEGAAVRITGPIGPVPVLGIARHLLLLAPGLVALVPLELDGVVRAPAATSGWRCARWGTVRFEQARIAGELVLARGAQAAPVEAEVLAWYRTSLAARAAGVAIAAMEHAARYGEERVQFGQPIGRFEALIRLRDDAETGAAAARLMALHAAWLLDRDGDGRADAASRARALAADVVGRATIDAVQILGGYGFVNDYPVEKLMRDARAFEALLGEERFERAWARRAG